MLKRLTLADEKKKRKINPRLTDTHPRPWETTPTQPLMFGPLGNPHPNGNPTDAPPGGSIDAPADSGGGLGGENSSI